MGSLDCLSSKLGRGPVLALTDRWGGGGGSGPLRVRDPPPLLRTSAFGRGGGAGEAEDMGTVAQ